jgi:hypothetical protein
MAGQLEHKILVVAQRDAGSIGRLQLIDFTIGWCFVYLHLLYGDGRAIEKGLFLLPISRTLRWRQGGARSRVCFRTFGGIQQLLGYHPSVSGRKECSNHVGPVLRWISPANADTFRDIPLDQKIITMTNEGQLH